METNRIRPLTLAAVYPPCKAPAMMATPVVILVSAFRCGNTNRYSQNLETQWFKEEPNVGFPQVQIIIFAIIFFLCEDERANRQKLPEPMGRRVRKCKASAHWRVAEFSSVGSSPRRGGSLTADFRETSSPLLL
ncbi:hypothetical protein CEXT_232551 [Caerostris extrusa]|uniref:Uncharacterized protein n=1 Tax=Caerostris extrusa TaxID=172846 RepID=A0AAV4X6R1_CAEEX|nr:hypothetical protein CEXT_232551 [Caerostris extrusa]